MHRQPSQCWGHKLDRVGRVAKHVTYLVFYICKMFRNTKFVKGVVYPDFFGTSEPIARCMASASSVNGIWGWLTDHLILTKQLTTALLGALFPQLSSCKPDYVNLGRNHAEVGWPRNKAHFTPVQFWLPDEENSVACLIESLRNRETLEDGGSRLDKLHAVFIRQTFGYHCRMQVVGFIDAFVPAFLQCNTII